LHINKHPGLYRVAVPLFPDPGLSLAMDSMGLISHYILVVYVLVVFVLACMSTAHPQAPRTQSVSFFLCFCTSRQLTGFQAQRAVPARATCQEGGSQGFQGAQGKQGGQGRQGAQARQAFEGSGSGTVRYGYSVSRDSSSNQNNELTVPKPTTITTYHLPPTTYPPP
jgi:hypothetical protein